MKLTKHYFTFFFLLIILTILSSCNGKDNSNSTKTEQKSNGSKAIKFDSKATMVYQDKKGNLWFASIENGVYKYDGKNLTLFTSNDGLSSYRVLSVQEDNFENLYFDTPEGVFKYNELKFTVLPIIENKESENKWKSKPGDLWFRMGWDKSGPYRFDGKNLYSLKLPKNKMENEFHARYPNASYNPYGIYSIYKDSKGNIWFGTSNLGVYLFDGKEISWMYENQLTETPYGGDFGIRSIAEDQDGNYWICNTNYKYMLLPNDEENSKLKSINFKRLTGIENNGKEVLYFLTIETDHHGHLLMQTYENGLWRNNGKKLTQLYIKDGTRDISPSSIYKDKQGIFWLGTQNDGIYRYDGLTFEKFRLNNKDK